MPAKIDKEDLLEDLRASAAKVDGRLSRAKYTEVGNHSEKPLRREFGTWNKALEAAGLEKGQPAEVSAEQLKRDLRRVANDLGRAPSANEYRELGERGVTSQVREFGSWGEAKVAAGLDREFDYSTWEIPKEDLIDELQRLGNELEYPPSSTDITEHTAYSAQTYTERFGSILEARAAAGLPREIGQPKQKTPRTELLDAIQRLDERIPTTPSQRLMDELGDYSSGTYINRFGTWQDALVEAGFDPNRLEPREVECDYCGETTTKYVDRIERSERDFCSRECNDNWMAESDAYRGENHPLWADNPEYYGKNWSDQREKTLDRDNHCCQSCGLTQAEHLEKEGCELHVHHIIPIREFDEPEDANYLSNLVSLCNRCHRRWEGVPVKPTLAEPTA